MLWLAYSELCLERQDAVFMQFYSYTVFLRASLLSYSALYELGCWSVL